MEPKARRQDITSPDASGGVILQRKLAAISVPAEHVQLRTERSAAPLRIYNQTWVADAQTTPYDRPPSEYTGRLRDAMIAVIESSSQDDVREFVEQQLPLQLLPIADSTMFLEDIHRTHVLIDALCTVHKDRIIKPLRPDIAEKARRQEVSYLDYASDEDRRTDTQLRVAYNLVHQVAVFEGLLGPENEWEDWLQFSTSDAETPAYLDTNLVAIMEGLTGTLFLSPKLFGKHTREIYQGFRDRLEKDRPRDRSGHRLGNRELPPFPPPLEEE